MYTYDDQLIDAVRVRRGRLASALLHREERLHRTWTDRLGTFLVSLCLAALIAAVCVAVSFVSYLLSNDRALQQSRNATATVQTPAKASHGASDGTNTGASDGDAQ